MRNSRPRRAAVPIKRDGCLIVGGLIGGMAGAMLGLLEAAHHAHATDLVPHNGYSMPIEQSDGCDRDPLVAWSVLGFVFGSGVGAVGGIVSGSLLQKQDSEKT